MGWWAERKAKKAQEAAQENFERRQRRWDEDVALLGKLIEVFTAASNGEDSVPNYIIQKNGERTLWKATGVFHEAGRTPSRYQGRSSGFSIPIVGGLRYRVGATQGQIIPGIELQMDKDEGVVLLTSKRIIFSGPIKSQEWAFEKMIGASTNDDESDYFFSVSNRQKTSGVRFDQRTGREFNRFLALALSAAEAGFDAVMTELEEMKQGAAEQKPVFELPAPEEK